MKSLLIATALLALVANAAGEFSGSGNDFSNSNSDMSESSNKAVTPVPATPKPTALMPKCGIQDLEGGMYSDLNNFAPLGPVTVSVNGTDAKETYTLSPCSLQPSCSPNNETAYATRNVDGACLNIYNVLQSSIGFNATTATYTNRVQTADLKRSLRVVYECQRDEDGSKGVIMGDNQDDLTLIVGTYKLCGSAVQPPITLTAGQCHVDFTQYNGQTYQANLNSFDKTTKTIDGKAAAINTCGTGKTDFSKSTELTGCPATPGFMAFMDSTNTCVVLDVKESAYNPNTLVFTTNFSSTGATAAPKMFGADASAKRTVIVKCGAEDSTNGETTTKDGETIVTYTSRDACGEKTNAAAPEDEGLSTGAIVGIVIGSLALIVIILVICRWKSTKGEGEEGEYERV